MLIGCQKRKLKRDDAGSSAWTKSAWAEALQVTITKRKERSICKARHHQMCQSKQCLGKP